MSYFQRQIFDVFDPTSQEITGRRRRVDVHKYGDWHLATTGFIVRKSINFDDQVDVLVQRRSQYVDIAQNQSDQSIATQMLAEDDGAPEHAIRRGLSEELGLKNRDIKTISAWNKLGSLYIDKKYSYNPDLWNRELVMNYVIVLNDGYELIPNFKVEKYQWVPWEEFVNLVRLQPNQFAKSVRLYCVDDGVISALQSDFLAVLEGNDLKLKRDRMFYVSHGYDDFVIKDIFNNGQYVETRVDIYKSTHSLVFERSVIVNDQDFIDKTILSSEALLKL